MSEKERMEEKMASNRKTARITGILFIIATVASIASTPFLGSIDSSNYLVDVSANGNQVMVGALFALIAAFASASIAISLYPILRKYSEGLALGAVGFRLIEGALYIVGVVGLLSLLALSQEFVKTGSPNSSSFQPLGASLLAGYRWAYYVAGPVAFCIGAMMYYYIFYQTKLVPRWLSSWGLVGAALLIAAAVLVMFHLIGYLSTFQAVLVLPIAVQEMVLALWLIVKGFNPSEV
ncbi:MAG TPA: DUF4386 domain-containing protein [Candidatus Bathyarchaeia archaeon]|nr:DUF4386 domain-containing protein [Candidatus Bathyarchaeia archaeon]